MANDNKTFAEIVKSVRRECNSYPLPNAAGEKLKLVREMEDAHNREIDAIAAQKTAEAHEAFVKNAELAEAIAAKDRQLEAASADAEAADAEIDRWRKQALEEDAAANALREENTKLRALVGELAECLYGNPCTGCGMYRCSFCKHRRRMNALVAKAREVVK